MVLHLLLLTGFKLEDSKRKTIYVFDEPAANLHSRAQIELLTYFEKMIGSGDKIIYSTHSHHMVDPRWLSGAYIVETALPSMMTLTDMILSFTG